MIKTDKSYDYFVMLHHPNVGVLVMVNEDETVALYETKEDAKAAAEDNLLAEAYGYEIFCRGYGE